jgi:phage terminase Nu1 subunit (DNA packaging protein)
MQNIPVDTLAKLLCITPRRVQQLAKEGVLPKSAHGEYELVPAVQGYIRFLQEEARQGVNGSPEMADSKIRLAKAKADIAERKAQIMQRQLVWTHEVLKSWSLLLSEFKTQMRNLPTEFAPRVRMAKNDGQAQKLLREGIDEALQKLSTTQIILETDDQDPEQMPEP